MRRRGAARIYMRTERGKREEKRREVETERKREGGESFIMHMQNCVIKAG